MHRVATKLVRPSLFNAVRNLTLSALEQQEISKALDKTRQEYATGTVVKFFHSASLKAARNILNPELEAVIEEMDKHPITRLSVSDSLADIAMITDREGWLREQVSKGKAPIDALREMYRRQPPVADWERLIDEVLEVVQGNSPTINPA